MKENNTVFFCFGRTCTEALQVMKNIRSRSAIYAAKISHKVVNV